MIVAIEGKVVKKEPMMVHLKVAGITYGVNISLNCSGKIINDAVSLHITEIIKEESHTLYGFLDKDEKTIFDTVIKINGVGPKVALAICSTFTPASFAKIVDANDVAMLKKVPGIGPKGASRILVELSGFVADFESDDAASNTHPSSIEASMALESLGFKKDQIKKALQNCNATDTSGMIKEALKRLQK